MDPMTCWDYFGRTSQGLLRLVKVLTTIAHVSPPIITAEQRNPRITKDLNHLRPRIRDVLTVYMVNVLWFGGSTGFGQKKLDKWPAKCLTTRKNCRCKAHLLCPVFTRLHLSLQTELRILQKKNWEFYNHNIIVSRKHYSSPLMDNLAWLQTGKILHKYQQNLLHPPWFLLHCA